MAAIFVNFLVFLLALPLWTAHSSIVLITATNYSLAFPDMEASFSPSVPTTGVAGFVFAAEPSNACTPLKNTGKNRSTAFLLVERGDCDFVTKVKNVQDADYSAAIIYNNEDGKEFVTMSGNGKGIEIYAVFVSRKAGQALYGHAGDILSRCYLFPTFGSRTRSIVAISFILMLTVFAVFSTLFFVQRHRFRLGNSGISRRGVQMTLKEVKALPVFLFDANCNNSSMETCAICLEEYLSCEKLRVLPCGHEFHVACIDQWLTTQQAVCPICKQDAHVKRILKTASEHTPLLTSCASQLDSASSPSIPVLTQHFQIMPLRQNLTFFVHSFIRTPPEDLAHVIACSVSQSYEGEDGVRSPSSLYFACDFDPALHPQSANDTPPSLEEDDVIQVIASQE